MSKLAITVDNRTYKVEVDQTEPAGTQTIVTINGQEYCVEMPETDALPEHLEWMIVNGRPYEITFEHDLLWLAINGRLHSVAVRDLDAVGVQQGGGDGRVKAPIPGLIARILVQNGQTVKVGDSLVVLEAMKMENEIHADVAGRVETVRVRPNQSVLRGDVLVEIRQEGQSQDETKVGAESISWERTDKKA